MKRGVGLVLLVIVLTTYFGCKKQENKITDIPPVVVKNDSVYHTTNDSLRILVDSIVGVYKLSGLAYNYSPLPPYYSDSFFIVDTLITITRYNDTSLNIGGLQCKYCPQCYSPQYCFVDEEPFLWFPTLTFYAANIDSVNFRINYHPNPAGGRTETLTGKRVR